MSCSRTQWQTCGCCRGSNLLTCKPLQPSGYRPSNINPTIAVPGKLLYLAVMSWQDCDRQTGPGVCVTCWAPRGLSWPFFLSATWSFVALKPRIKGHRKLPVLILDKHVDGLGRPHQHLHHHSMAYVTGKAIHGSESTYGWVMVRAVSGVRMQTCGGMTDRHSVECTVVRRLSRPSDYK